MSDLYISRLMIHKKDQIKYRLFNEYRIHQLVYSFFSWQQERQFLYFLDYGGMGGMKIIMQSCEPPVCDGAWDIEIRKVPEEFLSACRYSFFLRFSPVSKHDGKVTNVHGLMGEVRVQPWADSPEFLCRFKTLYVDETHWPIQVERARVHKNMVILKLKDITDVNGALALRNAILYIDRKDADLPEGSFFLADLMGMEVRDAKNGAVLGKIADVLTLPANNVYVVRGGEREWMIPAVPEFVAEVNIDEDYMRVNLMEGL